MRTQSTDQKDLISTLSNLPARRVTMQLEALYWDVFPDYPSTLTANAVALLSPGCIKMCLTTILIAVSNLKETSSHLSQHLSVQPTLITRHSFINPTLFEILPNCVLAAFPFMIDSNSAGKLKNKISQHHP